MRCPFCAEDINEEAIFCRHCRHDLSIPKPLIEEAKSLREKIEELEGELARLRADVELQRVQTAPDFPQKEIFEVISSKNVVAFYIITPAMLIVLCHYLTLYSLGFHRLYVQLICIGITLPFGYSIFRRLRWGIGPTLLIGITVALLASVGTGSVVWLVDGAGILPASPAEWRLTTEFALGLTLGTIAGNAFANALDRTGTGSTGFYALLANAINVVVGNSAEGQGVADRLKGIEKTISAATATAAAIGALYTGIASVLR